jgi:RND family efflux transporter MFP subunit
MVRAGEVIAEVLSLEFQNLQLELFRSQLQLELLEQTLQRLRPLAQAGGAALSARQLRETESARRAALQQRDSARRKLEVVGLTADQTQALIDRRQFLEAMPVRAPLRGAVLRLRTTTVGHAVKADEPLFEVHDLDGVQFRGFLAERDLPQVRIGQAVRVRLVSDPERVLEATVARSGQVVSAADRSLSLWAEVQGPPPRTLLPGMLARLTLVVSEGEPVLAVPREAVLREGSRGYLFVRRADGTFERRAVETGSADDRYVAVRAGVGEGEEVAVRGVAELQTAFASLR